MRSMDKSCSSFNMPTNIPWRAIFMQCSMSTMTVKAFITTLTTTQCPLTTSKKLRMDRNTPNMQLQDM